MPLTGNYSATIAGRGCACSRALKIRGELRALAERHCSPQTLIAYLRGAADLLDLEFPAR